MVIVGKIYLYVGLILTRDSDGGHDIPQESSGSVQQLRFPQQLQLILAFFTKATCHFTFPSKQFHHPYDVHRLRGALNPGISLYIQNKVQ